jgi:hypothetical protein
VHCVQYIDMRLLRNALPPGRYRTGACVQADVDARTAFRVSQTLRDGFFWDAATRTVTFEAALRNAGVRVTALWRLTLKRLPGGVPSSGW